MFKNHPEVFRLLKSVNARGINKNTINDLMYWGKPIPIEIESCLEKMIYQAKNINNALMPLLNVGFVYDLWLVGGCVRDVLLGNHDKIKDLDMMLSLYKPGEFKLPTIKSFLNKTKLNLQGFYSQMIYSDPSFKKWSGLNNKEVDYNTTIKEIMTEMIVFALEKNFKIKQLFISNNKNVELELSQQSYLDTKLIGVIKLDKNIFEWETDILVTDLHIENFLESFDFGVCKVALNFLDGYDLRRGKVIVPNNVKEILLNSKISEHFLSDVKNKILSARYGELESIKQIQHSCENHLPRLEKKYPWDILLDVETNPFDPFYKVNFSGGKKQHIDSRKEYIKSFLLKRELEKELILKKIKQDKKINKI